MTHFDIFSDLFSKSFQDHVSRLEADTRYRADFQASVAILDLDAWENSPKWKQTARFRKLLNPRCERCRATQNLHVHHKHYRHLGVEILYPGDLEVLCNVCHAAAHGTSLWPASAFCRPISQMELQFPMR